jgi:uncharacterized protein YoxC
MSNSEKSKKKGGFLSIFINQDETETTVESNDSNTSNTSTPTPNTQVNSMPVSNGLVNQTIPLQGVFNQGMYEHLRKTLAENNMPGIDYWEFQEAKNDMNGQTGMTEQSKYVSAFIALKAASGSKITKDSLLQAADFYIGIVDKEVQEFKEESAASRGQKVDALMEDSKQKEVSINEKIQLINKLNEEIAKLRTEVSTLQNEAQNNAIKIDNAINSFVTTAEAVKKQINDDKMNINAFIQ